MKSSLCDKPLLVYAGLSSSTALMVHHSALMVHSICSCILSCCWLHFVVIQNVVRFSRNYSYTANCLFVLSFEVKADIFL